MEQKSGFTWLDKLLFGTTAIFSTPLLCLIFRPDLFMKVATHPLLTEPVKYLILIFGN